MAHGSKNKGKKIEGAGEGREEVGRNRKDPPFESM